ncbi:Regulator of microtubule dynamics protein 1 [Armadillidium nasatum]|uniref:Regulator of microtubule dynamics protein 1 n=1 Tax=Armadillidium nasatum TaxID=96803 RepID=A0A5N5ST21_9CRUS|nr:Regulator of microtubule dynamics protein 1 [Armadillidium nasatum]
MQNISNFSPFLRFVFRNVLQKKTVDINLFNQCYIISSRTKVYITSFISSFFLRLRHAKLNYIKAAGSLFSGTLLYQYFENRFEPVKAASKSFTDLIKEADALYDQQKFEELYNILVAEKDSNNDEILWRLARALHEKARRIDDKEKKKVLYKEALNYLETANDINTENFATNKWLPIIMDIYYAFEGLKSRISHMYEMKHHMEKACKLKPSDGTSWYVLGMCKNYLMIGKCLYYLGRKDEAKNYFLKAKSYKGDTLDDQEARKEAEKWL